MQLLYVPPFPDAGEQLVSAHDHTSHPFHLRYRGFPFDGASLSEPQPNPESLENSRIIYILAREITVGFFYFRVTIYNPDYTPSGPGARMSVDLAGVFKLNEPRVGVRGINGYSSGLWLGPEGKRGIWMERLKDHSKRFVVAVSFDQSRAGVTAESGDELQELCEGAPRIESIRDVFVDGSRDHGGE